MIAIVMINGMGCESGYSGRGYSIDFIDIKFPQCIMVAILGILRNDTPLGTQFCEEKQRPGVEDDFKRQL